MPFLIELLALAVGVILLIIDFFNKQIPKTFSHFKIHIIGLMVNGFVMAYVLNLAL